MLEQRVLGVLHCIPDVHRCELAEQLCVWRRGRELPGLRVVECSMSNGFGDMLHATVRWEMRLGTGRMRSDLRGERLFGVLRHQQRVRGDGEPERHRVRYRW